MTLISFDVMNRWTDEVAFTAQIDCAEDAPRGWKLRLAVAWALAASVPMQDVNLDGADFTAFVCPAGSSFVDSSFDGSSFDGSSFDGSSFDGSSFVRSSFVDSRFVDSSFVRSSFDGSSFVRSSFVRSSFDGSSFVRSSFVDSRFVDSSFVRSSFVDSRFDGEDAAKADFLSIISTAKEEVPGLIAALREGRVDGSTYSGECACLVGTIANIRHVNYETLEHDSGRPAERWFLMISKGDKPGDNSPGGFASAKALTWAEEWCALNEVELSDAGER